MKSNGIGVDVDMDAKHLEKCHCTRNENSNLLILCNMLEKALVDITRLNNVFLMQKVLELTAKVKEIWRQTYPKQNVVASDNIYRIGQHYIHVGKCWMTG